METATMTTPSLPLSIIEDTKATDSEIDAYAGRVLKTMSSETCFIDDSLGPYVTSLLRCANIQEKDQVKSLVEFDSILELLEDQCSMDKTKASDCVLLIADAVITHVLPFSERTTTTSTRRRGRCNSFPLYSQQGGAFDSFRSISSFLDETMTTVTETSETPPKPLGRTDSSGAFSVGGPSPIKLDNLIPLDLMGELDDPSPTYSSQSTSKFHTQKEGQHFRIPSKSNVGRSQHDNDFPPLGTSPEAFPPLGACVEKPKKVKIRSSKKSSDGQQHSSKDLAATLFRPARPRQNSIESEEAASRSRGSSNASVSMMTITSTIDEGGVCGSSSSSNIYFQQQLNSCVEILLSMNPELSEEAASAAGLMANTDFNLAQHIIDSALRAPPICRHMLHDGCYRSDCTFSHDVDGHTCLFWLRGRCGKGSACKFFHGFHEKLLDGIDISEYNSQQQNNGMGSSSGYEQMFPPSLTSASTTSSSGLDGGFGGMFSPLLSNSWQTPSLSEASFGIGGNKSLKSPNETTQFSFANIASKGYEKSRFTEAAGSPTLNSTKSIPTVRIPRDLWNPHENRDASVFYISDPLERYQKVALSVQRSDVIDLHFQSTKTFPVVLQTMLPLKLNGGDKKARPIWIITGTGHHVGTKTHQKGGGALESAVIEWLIENNYSFSRGKDRNGQGGAVLVNR
mmetsp:Transcript_17048/g.39157  ORF Transcript_17048/g.39157 Transcript_17048/m.39157 type:complete len:681 (+) Transcript_17048:1152-3194(+)